MATALVDLYGGEEFGPFDRIILPEGYCPSEKDEFMCPKHRAYFLRKLKGWKEAIIEESRATMAQLQVDSLREPDVAGDAKDRRIHRRLDDDAVARRGDGARRHVERRDDARHRQDGLR